MLVARAVASARLGWRLPAPPGPSMWIVDPEPDPDADKYPRRAARGVDAGAVAGP